MNEMKHTVAINISPAGSSMIGTDIVDEFIVKTVHSIIRVISSWESFIAPSNESAHIIIIMWGREWEIVIILNLEMELCLWCDVLSIIRVGA